MDKLKALFDSIARDKKLHFAAGLIAGLLGAMWSIGLLNFTGLPVFLCGVVNAALVGAGKEVWDKFNAGTVDRMDVVYTAAGGVPTALLIAVVA